MDDLKKHLFNLHAPLSAYKALNNKRPKSGAKDDDDNSLDAFFRLLVTKTITMTVYRKSQAVLVQDVQHAASTLGIQVGANNNNNTTTTTTPPPGFVRTTENVVESVAKRQPTLDAQAVSLLYTIYTGLQMGQVTLTPIPAAQSATSVEDFGTKHYCLSSPVGVQAQFVERELPLHDDDNDDDNDDDSDWEDVVDDDDHHSMMEEESTEVDVDGGEKKANNNDDQNLVEVPQGGQESNDYYSSDEEDEWDEAMEADE